MADKKLMIPAERIENIILLIRGQKVILDSDLARIYGIQTFRLNEAVKRNKDRFPEDFLFQLTKREYQTLISQNAISKPGRGGRRSLPYAFTEHGAIMAANMLNSHAGGSGLRLKRHGLLIEAEGKGRRISACSQFLI